MINKKTLEKRFLEQVMQSQGIIHKVCHLYCDNEEHRKDLFQEILINLWRSYESFRGDSKFSSWMYRVALNVAIQDFRKIKKRKLFFLEEYQLPEEHTMGGSEPHDERFSAMHRAIAQLNKLDKAIVILYLEGHSNEEISHIVGITANYVRVKMNRIKKKLSKDLKQ